MRRLGKVYRKGSASLSDPETGRWINNWCAFLRRRQPTTTMYRQVALAGGERLAMFPGSCLHRLTDGAASCRASVQLVA